MEFEVNNQMGETEIFEEVTVNEVVPFPSEARGRAEENTNRTMQHINANIDIAAILQQLTEQRAENNKHLSQLTQQMTKQLAENTRQLEKRINDVKESIQENNIQIRKEMEHYVIQRVNEHRVQVDQQISEIKMCIRDRRITILLR